MYKLIVADDEDNIREGMCSIVNWGELGFEVVRVCADGDEVLHYLQHGGEADALLTDIRMVNVSGLELARYAMENHPAMRVVFLSGYREFEYARTAAQYNVRHYLLKPTQLSEIYRVFGEIRRALDEAHALQDQARRRRLEIERALGAYLERIMGGVASGEDRRHAAQLMSGIGLDAEQSPGIMLRIQPTPGKEAVQDWPQLHGAIERCYARFMLDDTHDLRYMQTLSQGQSMIYFACAREPCTDVQALVRRDFANATSSISRLLGITPQFDVLATFTGTAPDPIGALREESETPGVWAGFEGGLSQVCRQLFAHIMREDPVGLQLDCDEIMATLQSRPAPVRLNAIIELVTGLREKVASTAADSLSAPDYAALYQAGNAAVQKAWLVQAVMDIQAGLHPHGHQEDIRIILRAKEYIDRCYGEPISLKDVAAFVYLSPAYFSRLFKQYTQENFTDYLTRMRVEKAKALLLEGSYKVYEVSERVGYRNEKYFFRIFKKYTGQTPFEYGKRLPKECRP